MSRDLIIQQLQSKNEIKNKIFQNTSAAFNTLKGHVQDLSVFLEKTLGRQGQVLYKENGAWEIELHFSDEVLIFSMHTDLFNFDDSHFSHKLDYVRADSTRSYCGIIKVYNFLADSFRYNRNNDVGYLIARLFVNIENHYFVEGKRQLGFLYTDFENALLDSQAVKNVLESCMLYAIEFDLLVPPFDAVKEITLFQKIDQMGNAAIKTGKRLGFQFSADNDQIES